MIDMATTCLIMISTRYEKRTLTQCISESRRSILTKQKIDKLEESKRNPSSQRKQS